MNNTNEIDIEAMDEEAFLSRLDEISDEEANEECCKNSIIKPACLPFTILAVVLLMTFFIPFYTGKQNPFKSNFSSLYRVIQENRRISFCYNFL